MDDTQTPVSPSGQDTGSLGLPPLPETPATTTTTTTAPTEPVVPAAEETVELPLVPVSMPTETVTTTLPATESGGATTTTTLTSPSQSGATEGQATTTTTTTTVPPAAGERPKKKVSKKVLVGGLVVAVLAVGVVAVAALFPQFRGAMQQRAYIIECINYNDCGSGYHCSGGKCVANISPTSCSPKNGGWSIWGTCINGHQSRTCSSPSPSCGGSQCSGSNTQTCGGGGGTPPPIFCDIEVVRQCANLGGCVKDTTGGHCQINGCGANSLNGCSSKAVGSVCVKQIGPGAENGTCQMTSGYTCDCVASGPSACETGVVCNDTRATGSTYCSQPGSGHLTYCCPSGQTIVNNACTTPSSCPANLSNTVCSNTSLGGSTVCRGIDGRVKYCCPEGYTVPSYGTACVAPTPTETCTFDPGTHTTRCCHLDIVTNTNVCTTTPTTYPFPTCAVGVIPCPLGKICVPNTSGGSCVLEANVTPYCSAPVLPCPHGQYCVPDKRGGTCAVPTMTPRPSGTIIPTGTGGACGGLNQPCCAPENVGAGSICNNGLYCHSELGFKCTADANICDARTGGGAASGQCKVYNCGTKCNAGNQCTIGGTAVSCSQASALLGNNCGQIDYEKVGGGYCGVMSQNCYGACGGGGTPTTTPTVTQSPTCPFSSTQGQVHRNDQLPWADAIPNSADTNVMLPGQSFKIGGFHNGSGTLATDVIYTIMAGTTQLATHPVTSANDAIWTYTIAAGQTGTLTVNTTTRNQAGANCQDTATVTIGSVPNACVGTRIYLKGSNGQFNTAATPQAQLGSLVHVGDTIRMAVRGNKATFAGGRFIVLLNGGTQGTYEITQSLPLVGDPATREFYYDYTITQSGNYEIQGAVSVVAPSVTATPTKSPTLSETPMPAITPAWSGYPLPTDSIEAMSQYIQPDGKLRTNVFKGNRMWGYTCTLIPDGGTVSSCAATITRTLAETFSGITGAATAWAGNPIPTDFVDAVDHYMQPGGTLRTNVYKGNRYWGYNCTFQAGTGAVAGCSAVTTRTLAEAYGGVTGAATAWAGNPIPTDFVDAVDSYVQPNGVLRSTVFKGGRYWGFECTYQAGTATVTGCSAKTTIPLTQWVTGIGGTFGVALPTDGINAIGQFILPNGKARSNVFKGNRYWGYDCIFGAGGTTVTSCNAVTTLSLTQWAAGILPQ